MCVWETAKNYRVWRELLKWFCNLREWSVWFGNRRKWALETLERLFVRRRIVVVTGVVFGWLARCILMFDFNLKCSFYSWEIDPLIVRFRIA